MENRDFVIQVATANGSRSQSSNNILVRALFRSGVAVGGKNLFPSNIQGLPTWFNIRASSEGFTSRRPFADIIVALNPQTFSKDLAEARSGAFFFYSAEFKILPASVRDDVTLIPVPFRDIVQGLSDSIKLKKLLVNMVYVGILAELLQIDEEVVRSTIEHQFQGKQNVVEVNARALEAGRDYARSQLADLGFPYRVTRSNQNAGRILIDGNSAGAIGLVFGGCSFLSWYPITPSSSVVETFEKLADRHRRDEMGKRTYAVLQAEDELAAIAMVLGAGWMGARAATATSGPGLSLMAEAAGLSYFAEIPAVIWDVQRVGPSTGLPTRTMQGDLLSAHTLSHGDTKHVVLLPANPEECFEFARQALDLSERLQTLILVLSDLDLGMNFHSSDRFKHSPKALDRGSVLSAEDLGRIGHFERYRDREQNGIVDRTLPGTEHPLAAYFTRGTGHDESGRYSEDADVFEGTMNRLRRKWQTAASLVPEPEIRDSKNEIGLIAFGITDQAIPEVQSLLSKPTDYLRVRALPFTSEIRNFIEKHTVCYVIEQNRDGQMRGLLSAEYPELAPRLKSLLVYDGLPVSAPLIAHELDQQLRKASTFTSEVGSEIFAKMDPGVL